MAIQLTDQNFSEVTATSQPVLIDFWAEWCPPCIKIGPIVEEMSKEYENRAVIVKLDVDNNPQVSVKFGVRNIPTLLILKDGKVVDKIVGAVSKSVLTERLDAQLLPA